MVGILSLLIIKKKEMKLLYYEVFLKIMIIKFLVKILLLNIMVSKKDILNFFLINNYQLLPIQNQLVMIQKYVY